MQISYHPVWISSIKHLEEFSVIKDNNPLWKVLFRGFKIPEHYPQLLINERSAPLAYYANGELTIYERQINFRSIVLSPPPPKSYRNVNSTLHFDLPFSLIKSIKRYKFPKPFLRYFNIDWIQIKTHGDAWTEDFLVCVGGQGPSMNKIIYQTNELYELLNKKYLL